MEQEQTPLPFTPHEAWGHMRETLDREMPEKKRRRRFIFWLLPLALTGICLLWQNEHNGKNKMPANPGNAPGESIAAKPGSNHTTASKTQNTKQVPPAANQPLVTVNQKNTATKEEDVIPQNSIAGSVGNYPQTVPTMPRHLTKRNAQRLTVNKKTTVKQSVQPERLNDHETIPVLYDSDAETETTTVQEPTVSDYSLTVPQPLLKNTPDAPRLAEMNMPIAAPHLPLKTAKVKTGVFSTPIYYGIRTGWVLNHTGWASKKQPLFPQRLLPLELFLEKPLGKKLSAELSVNLFSSRSIQYGLHQSDSGTDVTGRYHLQNNQHTAQALHFTDIQLLLHRNLTHGWRLHGGVYFSVLKNIAVEVNNYDSSSRPTATGYSFESTTTTGYTYARKLNGVNLVSPFRNTDMGVLGGVSYRKKQWEAGLNVQAGLPLLYKTTAEAATKGPDRTLQLKIWLGLRLNSRN